MAYRSELAAQSALHKLKSDDDFLDCFSVDLPGETRSLSHLAQIVFINLPPWVRGLLAIRDYAVSFRGLKTTRNLPRNLNFREKLQVGEQINFLTILHISEQEIILGEDDKHLDFRIAFRQDDIGVTRISLASLVQPHNNFGRIYLRLILYFHTRIVLSRLRSLRT